MVRYIENGNLFDSSSDALVNPVNCKGAMGKGIAREFRKRFPECFTPYKQACDTGTLKLGILLFVQLNVQPNLFSCKRPAVILFPTKNHWRYKSQILWVEQGLAYLKNHYREWGLKSIAMPKVGCGLGGLKWEHVKSLIERYFAEEPVEVEVYLNSIYTYNEKPTSGKEETKEGSVNSNI